EQKEIAERTISELNAEGIWDAPIVTEIAPATEFYVAEDYHQEYYAQNASQPYCQMVVAPKVAKFRRKFLGKLKSMGQASA
ncbi:MAG: peptide-methionine (S)-S-oxide reductase, partial [Acidobacteriota bacterium]|nr:peptide-methionine (S)-S-oxide reductase [Acidobacteriota bacterium]